MLDSRHNYIPKYENQGIYNQLSPIQDMLDNINKVTPLEIAPWETLPLITDTHLSGAVHKNTQMVSEMRQISIKYMEKYQQFTHIYTDGAKDTHAIGCGFHCEENSNMIRLPNRSDVLDAEINAICEALRHINTVKHNAKVAIFSDSLSTVRTLCNPNQMKSDQRYKPMMKLCQQSRAQGNTIVLVWIPSHMGLWGNEKACKTVPIAAR